MIVSDRACALMFLVSLASGFASFGADVIAGRDDPVVLAIDCFIIGVSAIAAAMHLEEAAT